MMSPIRMRTIFWLFILQLPAILLADTVLFLGVAGKGAPAIGQTFERSLRDRIAATTDLSLIGCDETKRFCRKLDFDQTGGIPANRLQTLQEYLPDSAVAVWSHIEKLSIIPIRSHLIKAELRGELQTRLMIFNISGGKIVFSDTITGSAEKQKEYILFSPIDQTTISAADREEIIDKLVADIVTKCAGIIDSLRGSTMSETVSPKSSADSTGNREPSISDVFTVPSVEAAEISGKSKPSGNRPASPASSIPNKKPASPSPGK